MPQNAKLAGTLEPQLGQLRSSASAAGLGGTGPPEILSFAGEGGADRLGKADPFAMS